MNKLSALLSARVRKKSQYSEIVQATYGSNHEENGHSTAPQANPVGHGSSLTGISHMASSSNVEEETKQEDTLFLYLLRNSACVVILILLTIICSLSGERAFRRGEVAELMEDKMTSTSIKWRPCQIYLDTTKTSVQVLQTSLGDPSNQWGQVPCLVRNVNRHYNKVYADEWKWFADVGTDNIKRPLEYGQPSAVIRAKFEKVAHPEREPILGFGGAFTEASAMNYMTLDKNGKDAVMELLFGKNGLGYSVGRVPINSCDFSPASYSFDDVEDDFTLEHFDTKVEHDVMSGLVEFILQADGKLKDSWPDDNLNIMASPWSPPAWMKKPTAKDPEGSVHSMSMTGSAEPNCLREGTGPASRYAKAWALYFSKFLSAYKSWGIDLFAVTVQNEPEFPAPWEACAYDPPIQADFIANHLGPILKKDHPDVKLLIFDHNKDHAVNWGKVILDEKNPASSYVDGTAIHWYAGGMDRLLDGAVGQPNMHHYISLLKYLNVRDDHLVLGSEACHCPTTGYSGGDLKVAWARAERYAHTILADLAAGSNGWVEWNLILDSIGGPNHLGNLCDSPLLAVPYRAGGKHNVSDLPDFEHADYPFGPSKGDTRTREELNAMGMPAEYLDVGVVVQPMFYYMGHISRHVRPGSRSVHTIVDQCETLPNERTFREIVGGTIVAGGGINDLARVGVELTLWPCEGSTRQEFSLSDDGKLQVFGHDWLGVPTKSCFGKAPDESFGGLVLAECNERAAKFSFSVVNETNASYNIHVLNSGEGEKENCLMVKPLHGQGGAYGPRGGSQLTLGDCEESSAVMRWNETTGELLSSLFEDGGDICVTTGWPFLQAGGFIDSEGKNRTMVILNEASDPANFVLRGDEGEILMTSSIPGHSIQTVVL